MTFTTQEVWKTPQNTLLTVWLPSLGCEILTELSVPFPEFADRVNHLLLCPWEGSDPKASV